MKTSISPPSSIPIESTMETTFSSRGGVPQVLPSQALRKLSNKTFNPPRKASLSGHLVSYPTSLQSSRYSITVFVPIRGTFSFWLPCIFRFLQTRSQTTGTRSRCTFHPSGKTTNASNVSHLHTICLAIYTHTELPQVEFDPGCEAMIYTVDGTPLQGMSVL